VREHTEDYRRRDDTSTVATAGSGSGDSKAMSAKMIDASPRGPNQRHRQALSAATARLRRSLVGRWIVRVPSLAATGYVLHPFGRRGAVGAVKAGRNRVDEYGGLPAVGEFDLTDPR